MTGTPQDAEKDVEEWVRESLPKALVFARSLTSDLHTAEDLVHDCFVRLLAKRREYDLPKDGWKLLLRSITNALIDLRRRIEPILFDNSSDNGPTLDSVAVSREDDPSEPVMSRELELKIAEALKNLPWNQRATIELKSMGMSLAEIAEALSISSSNVGVLLHRARIAMKKQLENWLV